MEQTIAVQGAIQFTNEQTRNIEMINRNQDRLVRMAGDMIDIAVDTGHRLLALKDAIKDHGGKWKAWCKVEGNLSFSYEQANRYSKLAANPKLLTQVRENGVVTIEGAVMAIEHLKKPEKVVQKVAQKAEAVLIEKTMPAIRITPTKNPGSYFIITLNKDEGTWTKQGAAVPVYINKKTTVFELMEILEK